MNNLTDYEVLDLFDTYVHSAADYVMSFLTVYFAYLLTVYLVGNRLSPKMVTVMVFLYTAFTVLPATGCYVATGAAIAIGNEIVLRSSDLPTIAGSALRLYTGATGTAMLYLAPGFQFLAYLAGLVFLHETRKKSV